MKHCLRLRDAFLQQIMAKVLLKFVLSSSQMDQFSYGFATIISRRCLVGRVREEDFREEKQTHELGHFDQVVHRFRSYPSDIVVDLG